MRDVPEGYQIGPTEMALLAELETCKRQGIALLPQDFATRVGRAGTSSFKRFLMLKAALHEYGWQTRPERMRGNRPHLLQQLSLGPDRENQKLRAQIKRLEVALSVAENENEGLKADGVRRKDEVGYLRGLLMSAVTTFVGSDSQKAGAIESRLLEMIVEATGGQSSATGTDVIDLATRRRRGDTR